MSVVNGNYDIRVSLSMTFDFPASFKFRISLVLRLFLCLRFMEEKEKEFFLSIYIFVLFALSFHSTNSLCKSRIQTESKRDKKSNSDFEVFIVVCYFTIMPIWSYYIP